MKTTVVNFKTDDYDEFVARPSKWGNPFIIGRHGSRLEVIEKYRVWVLGQPGLLAALPELHGRRLGCYCAPALCHGNILAYLADLPVGPAVWKREGGYEPVDVTGVMGLGSDDRIYMRTVYGCGVPLDELDWPKTLDERDDR